MKKKGVLLVLLSLLIVAAVITVQKIEANIIQLETKEQQKNYVEQILQPETKMNENEIDKESEAYADNKSIEGDKNMAETETDYFDQLLESTTRRFKHMVEEDTIIREVPLVEEDFKQLKKGQYISSGIAKLSGAEYEGVVEVIGKYDGQILYTPRMPGTGKANTSPYYRIDENTYVILFFSGNDITYGSLDYIEVWDADGNKLREIEID